MVNTRGMERKIADLEDRASTSGLRISRLEEQLGVALDVAKLAKEAVDNVRLAVGELTKVIKIQDGQIKDHSDTINNQQCLIGEQRTQVSELTARAVAGEHVVSGLIANVHLLQTHGRANSKAIVIHENRLLKLINLNRPHGARRRTGL